MELLVDENKLIDNNSKNEVKNEAENEAEHNEEVDLSCLMNMVDNELNKQTEDDKNAIKVDYDLNYTVSELKLIFKYYKLSFRKMKKEEMINTLVDYETNEENIYFVQHRKQMWYYLNELMNDEFFKNYILIN